MRGGPPQSKNLMPNNGLRRDGASTGWLGGTTVQT